MAETKVKRSKLAIFLDTSGGGGNGGVGPHW